MQTRAYVSAALVLALAAADVARCSDAQGYLNLNDSRELVFSPIRGEALKIPYKRIRSMVVEKQLLTIGYANAAGGNEVVVVELAEDLGASKRTMLEARTGKRVEMDYPKLAFATRPPKAKPVVKAEEPKEIAIRFTSAPAGADVWIDGEYWGCTPTATFTRLPAGTHRVIVKRSGYVRWEQSITLAPGDDRAIVVELEVQPYDSTKPRIWGN